MKLSNLSTAGSLLILVLFVFTSFKNKNIFKSYVVVKDSSIKTKTYYKNGLKNEEDYKLKKIVQCRIYMGEKLMYISPIMQNKLQMSIIKLRSGNDYLKIGNYDTLEIINPQIPHMNFGIEVVNGQITYLGEKLYLIKAFANLKMHKVQIFVKVFQEMNSKIKKACFISDSAYFAIK